MTGSNGVNRAINTDTMAENQMKWADVAPYYLPIDIDFTGGYSILEYRPGGEWCIGREGEESTFFDDWDDVEDVTDPTYCKPILRHLEDITEGEAIEYASGVGNGIPSRGKNPHSRLVKSSRGVAILTTTVHGDSKNERYCESRTCYFDKLTPTQFHWLISKGFDIFGLIESNQAIRKEASK